MSWAARAIVLLTAGIWAICVLWPSAALLTSIGEQPDSSIEVRPITHLLGTTTAWGLAVACASMLMGWAPGRLLGSAIRHRGFVPLATLMLVPICMPSYIVFFAWWQSWPVDSAAHRWVVEHNAMQAARELTLLLGLACWSWPLVSICVAGAAASRPLERGELLQLDGAGFFTRWFDHVRTDARGLALGGFLVFLATLNNTTCFDLAMVFTFANEVRAIRDFGGAGPREVLIAGAPMLAIALLGAMAVWRLQGRPSQHMVRTPRFTTLTLVVSLAVWLLSVALPLSLFLVHVSRVADLRAVFNEFFTIYKVSVLYTLGLALCSALVAAFLAFGAFLAWRDDRWAVRCLAALMAMTWLCFALMPGTIIGVALEAAYNRAGFEAIFDSRLILIVGHVASFGFIGLLMARWAAFSIPKPLRDLQRIDGVESVRATLMANASNLLAAGGATLMLVFILSVGEIPVTAMIQPPLGAATGPLALSLLSDMHYQRPQTVMIAALGMATLAIFVSLAVAFTWRFVRIISPEWGNPQWTRR